MARRGRVPPGVRPGAARRGRVPPGVRPGDGSARAGSPWGATRGDAVSEGSGSGDPDPDPGAGVGGDAAAGGVSPESGGSSPRAAMVAASISPVEGSPTERWNSLSALRVRDPIAPSILPGSNPRSVRASWTASTIGSYAASTAGPQQDRSMSNASAGNALHRGSRGRPQGVFAAVRSRRAAPNAPSAPPILRVGRSAASSCSCSRPRPGPAAVPSRTFTARIFSSHRAENVAGVSDEPPAVSRARRCACQRLSHSLNPHAMTKVRQR